MSTREFAIGDLHFEHLKIVTEHKSSIDPNRKARPWYTLDDMHDELVYLNNQVVRPNDKLFILGDLAFSPKGIDQLARLNGRKILVGGNHDNLPTSQYLRHCEEVVGCYIWKRVLLSHMPVHPSQLRAYGGRYRFNVHGHLHEDRVLKLGTSEVDPNYVCVSAEQVDYAPILLDKVMQNFRDARGVDAEPDTDLVD